MMRRFLDLIFLYLFFRHFSFSMRCTLPFKKKKKKETQCETAASPYVDCTLRTCQATIELAAAVCHAGSHGEFPHVRQHDKRRI